MSCKPSKKRLSLNGNSSNDRFPCSGHSVDSGLPPCYTPVGSLASPAFGDGKFPSPHYMANSFSVRYRGSITIAPCSISGEKGTSKYACPGPRRNISPSRNSAQSRDTKLSANPFSRHCRDECKPSRHRGRDTALEAGPAQGQRDARRSIIHPQRSGQSAREKHSLQHLTDPLALERPVSGELVGHAQVSAVYFCIACAPPGNPDIRRHGAYPPLPDGAVARRFGSTFSSSAAARSSPRASRADGCAYD
jgi:hypothetical protein